MSNRPIQLGPDPNRTYLERWNEMHPDRYGSPDPHDEAGSALWQRGMDTDAEDGGAPENFAKSLLGLAIFFLAPLTGAIASSLIYRWSAPEQLTIGWVVGYAAIFFVAAWIVAMLVYALRRLLLAAAIAGATVGIGYLAWSLSAGW